MLTIYLMAGVLLVLALTHTVLLAWEYFAHDARWPFVVWILFLGAILVVALILNSESVWFWLKIFW
jgi:uncharacterized integral membrane protein